MSDLYSKAIYLDDEPKENWRNFIGPGYRSCTYTTDHEKHGKIILLGYDTVGNPKTFICPHMSHVKYVVKFETNEKDNYGRYIATKWFNSKWERDNFAKNAQGMTIVECLKPEQEFLHEMFDECVFDDNFNTQPLRIFCIDIETEISEQFMPPAQADNRINMITVHDSLTDKFYTWSLQHAVIDFKEEPLCNMSKDNFVLFEFNDDEDKLLEHFLNWFEDNPTDVICGWNVRQYDMPYIVTRVKKVLGDGADMKLSPLNRKAFVKEINHDNSRSIVGADIEVEIPGVFIADELVLYRDKFGIAPALDGGYRLDNVGEHEGLGKKIAYDGTLKDLYLQDFQKFYEYNVRDVDLAKRINDKCKMIPLARTIASSGLTNYNAIYSSISYLIGSVISFSKTQMGGKVFTSYLPEKKAFSSFEGAYVFDTIPGVYRGGIGVIDFASLYPSNIRTINASPETYVGKILIHRKDPKTGNIICNVDREIRYNPFCNDNSVLPKNENATDSNVVETIDGNHVFQSDICINAGDPNIVKLELKLPDAKGTRKQITNDQLKALIEQKCIWTTNNTLFLKHEVKDGVIAKWCEYFYNKRKSTKKRMLALIHKMHNDGELAKMTDEEKKSNEDMIEILNCMQLAFKTMINSIYGMLGTAFSPIANPDIAQSVTRQGRFANQTTSQYILQEFITRYNASEDYQVVVGGDTDSQFVNLQCVTDWMKRKYGLTTNVRDWDQQYKNELWKDMCAFVDDNVNPHVRSLIHDYCHTNNQNVLTYELEYMSACMLAESKKHYATYKMFDEGDIVKKIKYSGIELKKATVPKEVKAFLKDFYEGVLLYDWTQKDYDDYVFDLYQKFSSFGIDDISFWKGYNTAREAVGFLQMQKGATGISRCCTHYNQLIDKLGIAKKYDSIRVGDHVRMLYLDENNPYRINCIAYKPGQWPKEFNKLFKPDYHTMFNKIILDPLKKFRLACKFNDTDPSKQVEVDIFSM